MMDLKVMKRDFSVDHWEVMLAISRKRVLREPEVFGRVNWKRREMSGEDMVEWNDETHSTRLMVGKIMGHDVIDVMDDLKRVGWLEGELWGAIKLTALGNNIVDSLEAYEKREGKGRLDEYGWCIMCERFGAPDEDHIHRVGKEHGPVCHTFLKGPAMDDIFSRMVITDVQVKFWSDAWKGAEGMVLIWEVYRMMFWKRGDVGYCESLLAAKLFPSFDEKVKGLKKVHGGDQVEEYVKDFEAGKLKGKDDDMIVVQVDDLDGLLKIHEMMRKASWWAFNKG